MLVEAGPMVMAQLARNDLRAADIDHVFVTHSHGDHVLGFPMLTLNRLRAPEALQVYAGHSTIATLQMLGTLTFSSLKVHHLNLRWHGLSESADDEVVLSSGVTMRTSVLDHPPSVPTLGARWDFDDGTSLAFVTDTRPCEAAVDLARGCELLIHEASFSAVLQPDEDPAAHCHSTAEQAGEIARRAGCSRLALVHMGPEIGEQPDVLIDEARAGTNLAVSVPEDGEQMSL